MLQHMYYCHQEIELLTHLWGITRVVLLGEAGHEYGPTQHILVKMSGGPNLVTRRIFKS